MRCLVTRMVTRMVTTDPRTMRSGSHGGDADSINLVTDNDLVEEQEKQEQAR